MRIWDISAGYLNRQSLLGEHREIHGVISIIVNKKTGYSKHPETVRWAGYGWALKQRHRQLSAEMSLRGFSENTPVLTRSNNGNWPESYIDEPFRQFQILEDKYRNKEQGRIPLPKNAQQLWSQHKYSILARDNSLYSEIGKKVSKMKTRDDYSELSKILTEMLRIAPSVGGLRNALHHMWGYVSDDSASIKVESWSLKRLLKEIQIRVMSEKEQYLKASTALSELNIWIP